MANFLITSPNSLTQGTDTTDLFSLNTALGVTVYGGGGADQISASNAGNFVNTNIQGGRGGDSVYLTAGGAPNVASFLLGDGSDYAEFSGVAAANSTVIGGGGLDTINLIVGTYNNVVLNGNAQADLITASGATFSGAFVAGGGDNDVINFNANAGFDRGSINGGGGADSIFVSGGTFSGNRIEGDTIGETTFFGNDTIRLNVAAAGSLVQGGGGADSIVFSALGGAIGTGNTIEGNAGNDVIFINQTVLSGGYIGGGAGSDTIAISGVLVANWGTIQGGGGTDSINVSALGANGGFILGGDDADAIGLGTLDFSGAVRTNANASGVNVSYQSFSQSNLAGFDTVSATFNGAAASGGAAFMVTQSAVNFSVAAFERAGTVSGGATGIANFTGTFAAGLTARAAELDLALVQGQAVVFQNGAGTNFLFVQGGAAGSGADGDLVVQLNANSNAVSGGLFAVNNSALKVVIN